MRLCEVRTLTTFVSIATLVLASCAAQVVPLEMHAPIYPEQAVRAQISGPVEVEVSIAADGSVESASVVGKAIPLIPGAALDAARTWRFAAVADSAPRRNRLKFLFELRVEAPADRKCLVGPTEVTFENPDTVRIVGQSLPSLPTENGF
jgi:TonB family protein